MFHKIVFPNGIGQIHRDTSHIDLGVGRYLLGLVWFKALTGETTKCKFNEFDVEVDEMEEPEHEEAKEEIPISQMNKSQLMKFAKEHNIDTHGARNVAEAREMIQKAIRERNM